MPAPGSNYGYLTADLAGTGGTIKDSNDDFRVTELPAYQPCGEGEHVYLTIEKIGLTTLEAVRRIAAATGVPEREIGYAGMKDAVGVTIQTLSLPRVRPETVTGLQLPGLTVLSAVRHINKLRLGHLKGNRFRVVVRGVCGCHASTIEAIMETLRERGVPNWFGYQRYGIQGNSHLIGSAMLRRDWRLAVDRLIGDPAAVADADWQAAILCYQQGDLRGSLDRMPRHCRSERDVLQRLLSRPDNWEKAFAAVDRRLMKLYLSACQSALFDHTVSMRLSELDRLWLGDLAFKHVNGACFAVEDPQAEALRAASLEISPSGPMFGPGMKQPEGKQFQLEQQVLAEAGMTMQDFSPVGGLKLNGERRPMRVPLGEPEWRLAGSDLLLEFSLPRGSYATSVLREFTKNF
ncbi:MAG TPA: tRNA pseudouridine(13) synthase TruD [Deltaproteobacteria bacterium]|nr:tRNA pseudouridine(13) synthase TruD [Deltaproteobacteria bacterium]